MDLGLFLPPLVVCLIIVAIHSYLGLHVIAREVIFVDLSLAQLLQREVSDLIIAPDYDPDALALLQTKKNGGYLILQIDPAYAPPEMESRDIFGMTLQQKRNTAVITKDTFRNVVTSQKQVPDDVLETLLVATVALKYTQSNSVCVAYDGQVIGMGAGQPEDKEGNQQDQAQRPQRPNRAPGLSQGAFPAGRRRNRRDHLRDCPGGHGHSARFAAANDPGKAAIPHRCCVQETHQSGAPPRPGRPNRCNKEVGHPA